MRAAISTLAGKSRTTSRTARQGDVSREAGPADPSPAMSRLMDALSRCSRPAWFVSEDLTLIRANRFAQARWERRTGGAQAGTSDREMLAAVRGLLRKAEPDVGELSNRVTCHLSGEWVEALVMKIYPGQSGGRFGHGERHGSCATGYLLVA